MFYLLISIFCRLPVVRCGRILGFMSRTDPEFRALDMSPEAKAARLSRFVGSVAADDAEMVRFWRERSAASHARAGAELSDVAARMAAQTGLHKDPAEMFPGLSCFARSRRETGT